MLTLTWTRCVALCLLLSVAAVALRERAAQPAAAQGHGAQAQQTGENAQLPAPPPMPTTVQDNGLAKSMKVTSSLDELYRIGVVSRALQRPVDAGTTLTPILEAMKSSRRLRIDDAGSVQVFVTTTDAPESTLDRLAALGFRQQRIDDATRTLQGSLPIAAIQDAAMLPDVQSVREPDYPRFSAGSAITQGDQILHADQLRARLGSDGTGVKVGIISNGLYGISTAQASGDAPLSMNANTCNVNGANPTDPAAGSEGTAMVEIVHDIAPGAEIWFGYDGAGTPTGGTVLDFEAAVNCLAAHVDVVVDDVGFVNVGPYDGTSIVSTNASNALNKLTNPIRGYYTSVGNDAITHYQEPFASSGTTITGATPGDSWTLHGFRQTPGTSDWGTGLPCPNVGPPVYCGNTVAVGPGGILAVALSWNDPWSASTNDYDLLFVDGFDGKLYLASASRQTGGANPTELFAIQNPHPSTTGFYVIVGNYKGLAAPRNLSMFLNCLDCIPITNNQFFNFDTVGNSVSNNADAGGGVMSIGAAGISALNNGPIQVQPYSSRGPTADGRMKPDATAPDAVSVSGAGGFPTTFSGTSAASPHSAAVAALLLSCNPSLLAPSGNDPVRSRATLRDALLSMGRRPTPPDNVQGNGLLDAEASTAPVRCAPTISSGPSFRTPNDLATDHEGRMYVAALFDCAVFRLDAGGPVRVAGNGVASPNCGTFSGEGGAATSANIQPADVTFDASDAMYIRDGHNCRIYKVTAGVLNTIAGTGAGSPDACTDMADGPAATTPISPGAIAIDPGGDVIFGDPNCTIRKIHAGNISTIAGNGACDYAGGGPALSTAMRPEDVTFAAGGDLYITDATCRVLKLHAGVISTFAGRGIRPGDTYCSTIPVAERGDGGPALDAYLATGRLAFDPLGRMYISDAYDCVVRMISGTTITTFAGTSPPGGSQCADYGDGGPAIDAHLGTPNAVAVDDAGNVYIGDMGTTGSGPIRVVRANDKDGDALPDWVETGTGTYAGASNTGTSATKTDTDGDHCGDGKEPGLLPALDPNNPWDFYSVPFPALIVASNPVGMQAFSTVSAPGAQAVFVYFKRGAKSGTTIYEQDLNQNGIKDGLEYDRSFSGQAIVAGPPDGTVTAQDAQLAFAQFRHAYSC